MRSPAIDKDDPFLAPTPAGSTSILLSSAPTPYNTQLDTQVYDTASVSAYGDADPDVSFQPSLTDISTTSHRLSTYSSHPSAHLLSTPSSTSVPYSSRPVPAPPLPLRFESDASDLTTASTGTPTSSKPFTLANVERLNSANSKQSLKQDDVDAQRLRQLGYDPVLGRDYTFWSSLSISSINIGLLQGVIYAVAGAYNYGGPMMILVAWPLSGMLNLCLTVTLAELASAYPVSGAMASWAWKLARGGIGGERQWAWLLGGVVLGGHLGNVLLVTWQICNIITGTMQLAFDYHAHGWHSLLFFMVILLACGTLGSTSFGRSHRFWLGCGMYFLLLWFALCIALIYVVSHNPAHHISTHFFNNTGWSSRVYVSILGWQYTTIASGADASAHMAEETQRPSRNVPNAMVCSMLVSYLGGYIVIVLLLLAVRAEDAAEIARHPFPFGRILETAINSHGAIAFCCLLIIFMTFQVLAQMQASSRFVFALARDNAMPFAEWIRWTNASRVPVIANWVVVAMCLPFCTLTLAGRGTLYSILAVTSASLSQWGYVVPVILYLLSKRDLQTEGRTSWSLRRASKPAGCIGAFYSLSVIITQMFPGKTPVKPTNISWSPVVLVCTALTCLLTWKLYGSTHYSGPIRALTKWETGVEIDLQSHLASSRSKGDNGSGGTRPGYTREATDDFTKSDTQVVVESAGSIGALGSSGTDSTERTGWTSTMGTGSTSGIESRRQ